MYVPASKKSASITAKSSEVKEAKIELVENGKTTQLKSGVETSVPVPNAGEAVRKIRFQCGAKAPQEYTIKYLRG